MMTCSGCGHGLAAAARFCGVCGAPHAPAPTPAVAPAIVPHAPAPTPAHYAAPHAEPPRKGRALAAVILVTGLGAAAAIQLLARPGVASGPAPGTAAQALAPPQHELAVSRSTPAVATATTTTTTTTTTNNPGLPDPPTAPAPTAAADAGARATATALCENQKHGFAFAYPAEWFTASADPERACSLFDRQPFKVNAEPPQVAVRVELVPAALAVVESLLSDTQDYLFTSRTTATAAGRPAVVLEAEGTGQGDSTLGAAGYLWLIDRGHDTMIVLSEVEPGGDFAARKAEVDRLVAGLRLAATSAP